MNLRSDPMTTLTWIDTIIGENVPFLHTFLYCLSGGQCRLTMRSGCWVQFFLQFYVLRGGHEILSELKLTELWGEKQKLKRLDFLVLIQKGRGGEWLMWLTALPLVFCWFPIYIYVNFYQKSLIQDLTLSWSDQFHAWSIG